MKLRQLSFFLFLLLTIQICFGQEKPKAILIDRFGFTDNDSLQARIFVFFGEINKSTSKGYVLIHGAKNQQLEKYLFERHIKGCFRFMQLSDENFVFALAEDRNEFQVELWKVPNGAEKPQFTEIPRDYKISGLAKPYLIYQYSWDDEYCPLYFNLEFYSRFLKANSFLDGKIVIFARNLKNYQKVKQKYFRELTVTNKVSPQRIKFVRGRHYVESDVEFWLVPKIKK